MMRRLLAVFTAALLVLASANRIAASGGTDGPLDLKIGQNTVPSGAYYSDGELYLELEPVCSSLSYTLADADSNSGIRLTGGSDTIRIDPADNRIDDNGHSFLVAGGSSEDTLGAGCLRLNGVLYFRADLLARLMDLDVQADQAEKAVTVRRIIHNSLSVETKREDLKEGLLTATIQYPVLSGPWSRAALDAVNAVFRKAADTALAQGRQNAKELENIAAASGSEYGGSLQCAVYFDYSVEYNQNGLFSIILSNYQYAGGAHGSTVQTACTFDLSTGRRLGLGDLMKNGCGYEKTIDAQIREGIDARVKEGSLIEFAESPFRTIGDRPDFYLTDGGIVFYFQQYEHFPYAAGIQEFSIPYDSVSSLLDPSFRFLYQKLNRIS